MSGTVSNSAAKGVAAPDEFGTWRVQWQMAHLVAVWFIFVEFMRAFGRDYWLDAGQNVWPSFLVGTLLYPVFLQFATGFVYLPLIRLPGTFGRWARRYAAVGAGGVLSSLAGWFGAYNGIALVAMGAGVIGIAAAITIDSWSGRATRHVSWSLHTGILCGIVMLLLSHGILAGSVSRLDLAGPVLALGWCGVTAVLLIVCRNPSNWIVRLLLVGVFVLPAGVWWIRMQPATARQGADEPPNLVLIVVDTLRAKSCGIYGGPAETPSMARLGEEGALFERSYSLSNWTPPSMYGMFHSQYPPSLSADAMAASLSEGREALASAEPVPTLADVLSKRGYTTGAFLANYLVRTDAMTSGFGEVRGYAHAAEPEVAMFSRFPYLEATLLKWMPSMRTRRKVDTSHIVTSEGTAFLRRNADKPFALWLHYMTTHTPYDPPREYRTGFGKWRVYDPDYLAPKAAQSSLFAGFDAGDKNYIRSLYEGEVRYADDQIGAILDEIESLGLADNTIVCVTADHGEELFERGRQGHGLSLFEEQIHVPLLIAGPGVSQRVVGEVFSAIDLMPTLGALMGVEAPEAWRGQSWAGYLQDGNEDAPVRPAFSRGPDVYEKGGAAESVVDGAYKLIQPAGSETPALFDVQRDRDELHNEAESEAGTRDRLLGLLDAWRADEQGALPEGAAQDADDAAERLEQLRSLGYIN